MVQQSRSRLPGFRNVISVPNRFERRGFKGRRRHRVRDSEQQRRRQSSRGTRCGCVGVWLCGFVAVWLCGCVAVWLCDLDIMATLDAGSDLGISKSTRFTGDAGVENSVVIKVMLVMCDVCPVMC